MPSCTERHVARDAFIAHLVLGHGMSVFAARKRAREVYDE